MRGREERGQLSHLPLGHGPRVVQDLLENVFDASGRGSPQEIGIKERLNELIEVRSGPTTGSVVVRSSLNPAV